MQKTFKNQQGREFLLLDLPSDANRFKIFNDENPYVSYFLGIDTFREYIQSGNYQILCLAKYATEEQAAMVVDKIHLGAYINYNRKTRSSKDYHWDFYTDTAKESLTSLLTSLGFKQDDNVLILGEDMKTAEEIFNTIAFLDKNGDFFNMRREHIIEAMKEYAKQVAETALKDASENANLQRDWKSSDGRIAETEYTDGCSIGAYRYTVNKQSILQSEIKLP